MSKQLYDTEVNKQIIDNWFSNGFKTVKAYCDAKGIDEPEEPKQRKNISQMVRDIKEKNKKYVEHCKEENNSKTGTSKDKMVGQLEHITQKYFELLELADQEYLNDRDKERFKRLKSLISTNDFNKSIDTLAKLTGAYESKKVEVSQTFKVTFGGQAQLKESNKGIIDITPDK